MRLLMNLNKNQTFYLTIKKKIKTNSLNQLLIVLFLITKMKIKIKNLMREVVMCQENLLKKKISRT